MGDAVPVVAPVVVPVMGDVVPEAGQEGVSG